MNTLTRLLTVFIILSFTFTSNAQGRFKIGAGFNLNTNNYEIERLEPYTAFSGHASYRFIQSGKLSLAVESSTSLKLKLQSNNDKVGFITTLPVLGEIDLNKVMLYIGTGPGYVFQQHKTFEDKVRSSFVSLSNTAGIAFKGGSFFNDVLYPEYNIRVSYLNSLDGSNRAAYTLSFVVFLRSVQNKKQLQPVG